MWGTKWGIHDNGFDKAKTNNYTKEMHLIRYYTRTPKWVKKKNSEKNKNRIIRALGTVLLKSTWTDKPRLKKKNYNKGAQKWYHIYRQRRY